MHLGGKSVSLAACLGLSRVGYVWPVGRALRPAQHFSPHHLRMFHIIYKYINSRRGAPVCPLSLQFGGFPPPGQLGARHVSRIAVRRILPLYGEGSPPGSPSCWWRGEEMARDA